MFTKTVETYGQIYHVQNNDRDLSRDEALLRLKEYTDKYPNVTSQPDGSVIVPPPETW